MKNIKQAIINFYYDYRYGRIVASAIKKGSVIYTGKRQCDCFIQRPKGELCNGKQGFITESNRFVDRKLAYKIASHYNQIINKHNPKDVLFSEDLW